jgi:cupin fold WbuC family metalloprotein
MGSKLGSTGVVPESKSYNGTMEKRPAVQLISEQLIGSVIDQARQSARRRKNYNFHTGDGDNPQRFLNVFLADSYLRPHRHLHPPKAESFLVLMGHLAAFVFDDGGSVVAGHLLGDGPFSGKLPSRIASGAAARGIDLQPGLWHCVAALSPVAVCYEVKPGPWDPTTDKEFALWAPEEGSAAAAQYLATLLA